MVVLLLIEQVLVASDCIGNKVEAQIRQMQAGQVLLLENTRFHKGEEKNDPTFSKQVPACEAVSLIPAAFICSMQANTPESSIA